MYFTPATDWCWIGNGFAAERIAGEYVWLWIATLASIVLYIPLFFIMKGTLDMDTSSGRGLRIRRKAGVAPHLAGEAHLKVLLYPVAYTVLVLPLSVVRWINFETDNLPFGALFAVSTLFQLTGLVNVILFLGFRGSVTLLSSPEDDEPQGETMENGNGEGRGHKHVNGGLTTGIRMNDTRTIEPLAVPDAGLPD